MTQVPDHDAYISAAPEVFRTVLADLRRTLRHALPDAVEVIAYNMPGFRIAGATVAGYAAFSRQCGLYVDGGAIAAHSEWIAGLGLKHTKTGVTFTAKTPLPADLVRALALGSRKELAV